MGLGVAPRRRRHAPDAELCCQVDWPTNTGELTKGVSVSVHCNTVLYPVKDVDQAKAVFAALFGATPHVDSPYYVGFSVDGNEIGLIPNGHDQGMSGPEAYYDVDDIVATLGALEAVGAVVIQQPTDVAAGLLVAKVKDVDGNLIGLKQLPAS
jgi:predicted enzyme related to lactoylglutathione lyase